MHGVTFYAYVCAGGHPISSQTRADRIWCRDHEQYAQRRWIVNTSPTGTFQAHFNHSIGQWVTSSRDFDEKLKIVGEQNGSQLTRIDPGDQPRPTTDDGIFDTQARTLREKGFTDDRGKVRIADDGNYVKQS